MIIESVHIKNFRSVLDETLHCANLTALVGPNGAGKSTFLRGLSMFYNPPSKLDDEDFYNRDTTVEIAIVVTFTDLSEEAKELFAAYLQNEKLTVECVLALTDGKVRSKYHGALLQHPEFQHVKDAFEIKDRGKTARGCYDTLRARPEFKDLPEWANIETVRENLKQWEESHPDQCVRNRDDGQFFGFKGVAQGYLGKFTRFLFVPAVRDAGDDTAEGRGTVFSELMDLVVRSSLATNQELQKLRQETQDKYNAIVDPAKLKELSNLAANMTGTLKSFAPDASVDLLWLPLSDVSIPLPQAEVKLVEDDYASAVIRVGHGLQRAFILTMLQHLSVAQTLGASEAEENKEVKPILPDLILAIEEPELYQHPSRQRHMARILLQLATGQIPGVAKRTQVFYATHSPLFVCLDRVENLRLFRKCANEKGKPKITKIIHMNLDKVADEVWRADGEPGQKYTGKTLLPRLQTIMTPWMSEGFFADVAVLVEGEDDRAAILGVARTMGHELESMGCAVIPCGGKTSLDRPTVIFRQLSIPVYVLWDGDKGDNEANPHDNHRLLRLFGQDIADHPSLLEDEFACFEIDMETTLQQEIGTEEFDKLLAECQREFSIPKKKHAKKNPAVIAALINKAKENGHNSPTLEAIVTRILALKTSK